MAKKKVNNTNKLSEPSVGYNSNRIKVFSSFEEHERFNAKAIQQQDPLERIRETVRLILKVYSFTQKSLKKRKKIIEFTLMKPNSLI